MQTSALSAISQAGAINAEQMLQLVQKKSEEVRDWQALLCWTVALSKTSMFILPSLKNPGSGYEHHFKPSSCKLAWELSLHLTGTANAAGIANPWLEGSINLTRQMALDATDPDLAAVLRREAGK